GRPHAHGNSGAKTLGNGKLKRFRNKRISARLQFAHIAQTWEVRPDGTYRALTDSEDLISDAQSTLEDVAHTSAVLREVMSSIREAQHQSRLLIKQSRRERRLRTSPLRLVK